MTLVPKVMKLQSDGVYLEIPIVTRPVVYNPSTGLFSEYKDNERLPDGCKVIERWTIN